MNTVIPFKKPAKKILITSVVPPEYEALRLVYKPLKLERQDEMDWFEHESEGITYVCLRTGMAARCSEAVRYAIQNWKPKMIVDFGIASAVASGLTIGDVVIADKLFDRNGIQHDIDHKLVAAIGKHPDYKLVEGVRMCRGILATAGYEVVQPDVRYDVHKMTKALCADEETAIVHSESVKHGLEFLSFRMISDCSQEDLGGLRSPDMQRKIYGAANAMSKILG